VESGLSVGTSRSIEELNRVQNDEMQITSRERSDNLAQEIIDYFTDAIDFGRLKSGDRLPPQRKLATQFGVAISTVRKALSMLVEQSLVIQRRGSGTYVATSAGFGARAAEGRSLHVSPQDVLEASAAIEPGFVQFVVARATQEDFALMEAWLDEAEQSADLRRFRRAIHSFHMAIARATRNSLLIRMFEIVIEARARVGWKALRIGDETQEERAALVAGSRRVLAALGERDAAVARRELEIILTP
jgi:DNA-binding FadR family transcriptional regulator